MYQLQSKARRSRGCTDAALTAFSNLRSHDVRLLEHQVVCGDEISDLEGDQGRSAELGSHAHTI